MPDIFKSAGFSIPFANLPINVYIRGPRYKVDFDRISTPRIGRDSAWDKLAKEVEDAELHLEGAEARAHTCSATSNEEGMCLATGSHV